MKETPKVGTLYELPMLGPKVWLHLQSHPSELLYMRTSWMVVYELSENCFLMPEDFISGAPSLQFLVCKLPVNFKGHETCSD